MKNIVAILLLTGLVASPALAATDTPEGQWQLPSGAQVAIAPCADALCGHVTRPAAHLRPDQPLLRDLRPDGEVWHGEVWAEQLKDWANVEITRSGDVLHLKACAMLACRTREWRQVSP